MRKIYLLTTDHLEDGLWFRDEEDFKVAMNYIAIQAASCPEVIVLAFILMSNHVHFVLQGLEKDVLKFINQFKQRYALYYHHKYGVVEFLRRNSVDLKEIPFTDNAIEMAIAYVQMNAVAANICDQPDHYPWGTGSVFFNMNPQAGMRTGSLSGRQLRSMLHTRFALFPDNWMISGAGYILPHSYVAIKTVEAIFKTPKRMNYFLRTSSKARKIIENGDDSLPAFRDQIILQALPDLCRSLFHKNGFDYLSPDEKVEFVRQIRYRFSADSKQIARVCGLTYDAASKLLDNY